MWTSRPFCHCTINNLWFCVFFCSDSSCPPSFPVTVCINPIVANARQLGGQGLLSAPGQTVTFQCQDGYSLQGSASVSCQEDGSWQPPAPVCHRALPHHNSFNRSSGTCHNCLGVHCYFIFPNPILKNVVKPFEGKI